MSKIIINPIGGLANRMRTLAAGISLARELGCDYKVVWYMNWELNARIDEIFKIPPALKQRMEYPSRVKYGLIYSVPRKKNLYISTLTSRIRFGGVLRDCMPESRTLCDGDCTGVRTLAEVSVANNADFLLQGGTAMYPFPASLYREIFKPSDLIEKRVEEVINVLGKDYIGLHIRRSDNAESILHSPDQLFIQEIDAALEENPETRFYLATDSQQTKEKFKKLYGTRITFNPSKAERGTSRGIIDAAVEMCVLSRAKLIIGSYYSSFSEAAATLGDIPLRQVFRE